MKRICLTLTSALLLTACGPDPNKTANPTNPAPSSAPPTALPTPLPAAPVGLDAQIRSILSSQQLDLRVSEELMLIGDVTLSNGEKVSFDAVAELLQLENRNPDLLRLDVESRLIRALKAGTATVIISARQQPDLKLSITVRIAALSSGLDPNVALVDVEIE